MNVQRLGLYFAIGVQLAGLGLFLWMYALTNEPIWGVMAGWCVLFGALHGSALRALRKREGVEV